MAFGNATFSDAGGAVSDLFSAFGSKYTIQGDVLSAAGYGKAASIARQNETLEGFATKIKQTQQQRQLFQTIGGQFAAVGAAGFKEGGTALDLLRDSASQGALAKQLIGEQGAIQQNTFEEQATAYDTMQSAALAKAKADQISQTGKFIGAGLDAAAAIGTLFV